VEEREGGKTGKLANHYYVEKYPSINKVRGSIVRLNGSSPAEPGSLFS
jgi:hypothetical protein